MPFGGVRIALAAPPPAPGAGITPLVLLTAWVGPLLITPGLPVAPPLAEVPLSTPPVEGLILPVVLPLLALEALVFPDVPPVLVEPVPEVAPTAGLLLVPELADADMEEPVALPVDETPPPAPAPPAPPAPSLPAAA